MKPIKAVLFDIDGTLIDSDSFVLQTFSYVLQSINSSIAEKQSVVRTLMGRTLEDMYATLAPDHDVNELCELHRNWQRHNMHMAKPFASVPSLLSTLQEKHIAIGAVTNRMHESAGMLLELNNLTQFFSIVITPEDVRKPKPHPEGIQKALEHMSVGPNDAIMVGDSEFDIQAGKHAGTITVGVTTGIHTAPMLSQHPDHIFDDIGEVLTVI